jgi:3-isopropylmalate/(R)-2-methylmalate dehydratase large subunit
MKRTLLEQLLLLKGVSLSAYDTAQELPIDHIYGHDRNTFKIINEIERNENSHLADAKAVDRWCLFMDHYSPPPTIEVAKLHVQQRQIAREHPVFLSEEGEGVGHQVAVEKIVGSGEIVIGVDSHTCTVGGLGSLGLRFPPMIVANGLLKGRVDFYTPKVLRIELNGSLAENCCAKDIMLHLATFGQSVFLDRVIEFGGTGLHALSMSERFTLANLTSDLKGRGAIVETDQVTKAYLYRQGRGHTYVELMAERSAYEEIIDLDLREIKPMVASPPSLFTSRPVAGLDSSPRLDVVTIGSCTNGRFDDFVEFINTLGSDPIAPGLRLFVTPASKSIYKELLNRGLLEALLEAGAVINPPGCGPCMGLHQGVLQDGEICLATGSQNQSGRMGSTQAQVYLSGPKVAGASARAGYITTP